MNFERIVFAGTPDFAVPSLDALVACGRVPVAVYTQPDRPAGRGRKLTPSPVKRRALELGIPVVQPASLKAPAAVDALAALRPDLMVVIAYGQILSRDVLALPTHGCVNVHASLLPRWRGAAPIQRALLAGDRVTGVSIMQMDAGLDTGPVLLTRELPVLDSDTGGSLHDKLARLGAEALCDALARPFASVPQPDHGATYAHKLAKDEAWLDWSKSAAELERQVRAFNPWPVAQTSLDGTTLRIWSARSRSGATPRDDVAKAAGTIVSAGTEGILVATGDGDLLLTEVQLPGARRIAAADFANQRPLLGARLG